VAGPETLLRIAASARRVTLAAGGRAAITLPLSAF
jgi:hypothetical protein